MSDACPPEYEDFLLLAWSGPYFVAKGGEITPAQRAQLGQELVPADLPPRGVYSVVADHHVYGSRALLYIGRSDVLRQRVGGHGNWLVKEWRPEVYVAEADTDRIDDVERLLVCAHSPPYNAQGVGGFREIKPALRIWNVGSFFRLLPEVSSTHPWCGG